MNSNSHSDDKRTYIIYQGVRVSVSKRDGEGLSPKGSVTAPTLTFPHLPQDPWNLVAGQSLLDPACTSALLVSALMYNYICFVNLDSVQTAQKSSVSPLRTSPSTLVTSFSITFLLGPTSVYTDAWNTYYKPMRNV